VGCLLAKRELPHADDAINHVAIDGGWWQYQPMLSQLMVLRVVVCCVLALSQTWAILDLLDGRQLRFELFPMQRGEASALHGRVVRIEDRSGHHLAYRYLDADLDAALADPRLPIDALWRFQRISDQRGVAADFTWTMMVQHVA